MDSLLYFISLWWLLEWIIPPMPERTTERMLTLLLCFTGSSGLLAFYFVPRWHRQDEGDSLT